MPIDSDENVKIQTEKLLYGILLVCFIGALFYLLGIPTVLIINDMFSAALTRVDVEIVFCIIVAVSVKVLWGRIDKRHGVNRVE